MTSSQANASPLRQRMIDDMRMRQLSPKTQDNYLRIVREFARFLGRSPDTASVEDLRRYQLHLVDHGTSVKRHKVDREIDLKSSHRQIRERAILKNRFLSTRCRIIDVKSSHLAGRLTPSMTTF